MTPVEAVARAIEPDLWNPDWKSGHVRHYIRYRQKRARAKAVAALAAIRTPTPKMVEAMMTAFDHNGACADLWQAAIDAAMDETDG